MKPRNKQLKVIPVIFLLLMPVAVLADNCSGLLDCFGNMRAATAAAMGLALFGALVSMGLDFIPIVGTIKGGIEAITGRDLITGQQLSAWERALGILPFAAGLAGAATAARALDKAADTVRAMDKTGDAVRTADKAADTGRAIDKTGDAGRNLSRGADDVAGLGKEKVPNSKCTTHGEPVDVATGRVFTESVDFELPGPVPLVWGRIWYADSLYNGPLGHGWHHRYDMAIQENEKDFLLLRNWDGRDIYFRKPGADEKILYRKERLELSRADEGYVLWSIENRLYYYFKPVPGISALKLVKIANTHHHAITLEYNEKGWLNKMTDSAGRKITILLTDDGHITSVLLPDPQKNRQTFVAVTYMFDNDSNLVQVTDPLGEKNVYEYTDHLLTKRILRNGICFYFRYEGKHPDAKCIRTWGDNDFLTYAFQYFPGKTMVTNFQGAVFEYSHNNGLVTIETNSLGAVKLFSYNEHNELIAEQDPLSNTTLYEYDERGNRTSVQYPDGSSLHTAYKNDLAVYGKDPNGHEWKWQYDDNGNLTERILPTGSILKYKYEAGLLVEFTDAANNQSKLAYDDQYNLRHLVGPDNNIQSWLYDNNGRYIKYTDLKGNEQWVGYDLKNRVVQVNEPDGNERHFTYDGVDNLLSVRDREQDIRFEYTQLNSLSAKHEGGGTVKYYYNQEGVLTGITNQKGDDYTFILDGEGSVIAETGFDGLTRRFTRDLSGKIVEINQPGNQNIRYDYDVMNRVVRIHYSDGETSTFNYDKAGFLTEAINNHSKVTMEYDVLGRKIKETQGAHIITTAYDVLNNRTRLRSDIGADIQFRYNNRGDLQEIESDSWQAHIQYDALGLEVMRSLPGNVTQEWQRDKTGRPLAQIVRAGNQEKRKRVYQWQGHDRLKGITDTYSGFSGFDYDITGNLAGAQYNHEKKQYRIADLAGNYYKKPEADDRIYGKAGQLLKSDVFNYQYDELGNLTEKTGKDGQKWHYRWHVSGFLKEVQRPDEAIIRFTYDALGRRIVKHTPQKEVQWIWDGDVPLHELQQKKLAENNIDEWLTWIFEESKHSPTARLTKDQHYSILTDHLGTPLEMYDGNGEKAWNNELDIYGFKRHLEGSLIDCPFRYQGQYEDEETGLYYNRFRYYDPEAGSYISQDPIRSSGGTALYAYVHDPNAWIDVFGLSQTYWLEKALIAAGRIMQPGQTAHHIVQLTNTNYYAQLSRDLLSRHGLHPDIAANGARLWGTHPGQISMPNHPGRATARATGNYHAGRHIHNPANDKLIHRILSNAEKRGINPERILEDIGKRMESGQWKNSISCH
ncbi:hypothetical protein HB364_30915 [Pseudoflavitalea sp. X16]|uniref:RHS repeat-associated core domain-containing protein n=1 Tax=Paraflavitalea devenefica TaxID=2716334 RepID=UPI001422C3AD|nr:RHS repeat-associated core domain-containing protein [Paraflavitalea devenefica]NII29532.1 hypothetical protein [Paraflavitalea devenefica]